MVCATVLTENKEKIFVKGFTKLLPGLHNLGRYIDARALPGCTNTVFEEWYDIY
jgi:hypothetical protein